MKNVYCAKTEFGDLLLNILDSRGDYQKDMATKCNVVPSYISGIISGNKCPSISFISTLKRVYKLSDYYEEKLIEARKTACLSSRIDLSHLSREKRDLALTLKENITYLTRNEVAEIMNILTNCRK